MNPLSAGPTYPRPLLRRDAWLSLDGEWRFAYDDLAAWETPGEVRHDRVITVPYPPESAASGVHDPGFHARLWYERDVSLPPDLCPDPGERLLLHFGAVDHAARVWVDGGLVAEHEGGHTPFCADITRAVGARAGFTLQVHAFDDPHDLGKPRGKQDWHLEPHDIWYPRTSGIWQTVWLERVAGCSVEALAWTPQVPHWELAMQLRLRGPVTPETRVRVTLSADGAPLAEDSYRPLGRDTRRRIGLSDGGIDNARDELLWSPEHPQLIDAVVEVWEGDLRLDRVVSYTALRSAGVDGEHFLLNGRPYPLKMVLDQGYWPRGLMSASDAELRRDVELTRLLGFNGARKHQKVEDPRYLYWADVLGLLVWEELPSAYRFTPNAVQRLSREWTEAIRRDRSHPCIVAWVPFNESWGVPDLPQLAEHRDLVRALYHLTKTLDPTRPVIGNDGWEHVVTDIVGVHDYSHEPAKLRRRYGTPEATETSLRRVRPGKRRLALPEAVTSARPVMLSEFGGVACSPGNPAGAGGWGYDRVGDGEALAQTYAALLEAVHDCEGLAGFCYTQLTDTFQEQNGLLFADRTPKAPLTALAASATPPSAT